MLWPQLPSCVFHMHNLQQKSGAAGDSPHVYYRTRRPCPSTMRPSTARPVTRSSLARSSCIAVDSTRSKGYGYGVGAGALAHTGGDAIAGASAAAEPRAAPAPEPAGTTPVFSSGSKAYVPAPPKIATGGDSCGLCSKAVYLAEKVERDVVTLTLGAWCGPRVAQEVLCVYDVQEGAGF